MSDDDDDQAPTCPEDVEALAWCRFIERLDLDEAIARSLFWVGIRPPRPAAGMGPA